MQMLSLVTAVISMFSVGAVVFKVIVILYTGKHKLLLEYTASITGLLVHGLLSSKVFKKARVILDALEMTLTAGIDML